MKPQTTILSIITLVLGIALAPIGSAQSPEELWKKSEQAMKAEKWSEAHELLTKAVERYDSRAPKLFGPKFGRYWYHKGRCELELKKWKEAAQSFTKCRGYQQGREKFAINLHYSDALAGKAEAIYQLKRYEEAAKLCRQYVAEQKRAAELLRKEDQD